jgi:hypothetical protein
VRIAVEEKVSGRFFVKKLRKKLLSCGQGLRQRQGHQEQKFFAELFYKKATAYFLLLAFPS